jgi:mannose-6-phosphate isomerase-like protein (cupin superfamily)
MKPILFVAGVAVGVAASMLLGAQGTRSSAVLNTPGAYVEVLTLVPGEGSGQHSTVTAEVGIVSEGDVVVSSPSGRELVQGGKAYWFPGLVPHDVRNEGNRPAKIYVIAMKRCD